MVSRRAFFSRIFAGVAAAVVAPKVLAENTPVVEPISDIMSGRYVTPEGSEYWYRWSDVAEMQRAYNRAVSQQVEVVGQMAWSR
jgi:hypothetical protein